MVSLNKKAAFLDYVKAGNLREVENMIKNSSDEEIRSWLVQRGGGAINSVALYEAAYREHDLILDRLLVLSKDFGPAFYDYICMSAICGAISGGRDFLFPLDVSLI